MDAGRLLNSPEPDRGLAVPLSIFAAMFVLAALMFILLDPAMGPLFDQTSAAAETSAGQAEIDQAQQIWGLNLFYFAFLPVLWLIARAVRESRRPG